MVRRSGNGNKRIVFGVIGMHEILVPEEVNYSELIRIGSLSPNNYKKLSIKNKNQVYIRDFLQEKVPFIKGKEPGSSSYVKESEQIFLRNSCINNIQYSADKSKYIFLNPNYYDENALVTGDILFCTDANIGDCCLYISDEEKVIFSSGVIKLQFKKDNEKYYVMAFLRDDYFREQLDAKTPKGATIRHSGDRFLDCLIPECPADWVLEVMESLIKNISYSEYESDCKLRETERIIKEELINNKFDYVNPTIKQISEKMRLDSGVYSDTVFQWLENVKKYRNGFCSLEEFGFELKRGPNLAKRDLGRSIQTESYRKGYSVLIYPSDISSSGYIEKVSYLGARNPIWYLEKSNILFSAEGTIGKTFVVCDENMHFTTNFHGTIVKPIKKNEHLNKSVFLGLYLNFLRSEGVFDRLAVGGNGGSFAVGYWNNILIPNVNESFMESLQGYYHSNVQLNSTTFDREQIRKAGIYELNQFLIKTKAVLSLICNDIKSNQLKERQYYEKYGE